MTATKKTATKKTATKKTAAKMTAAKKAPAKKAPVKKATQTATSSNSAVAAEIEQRFKDVGGWRGATLARMRSLILGADPELVEERKWIKPSNPFGVPTYSRAGLVLTLEVYKDRVKVTFAQGSKVKDPTGIFNNSLLGLRRAVDVHEGDVIDGPAFQALVRGAVKVNVDKRGAD